jgi:hypothetical protein
MFFSMSMNGSFMHINHKSLFYIGNTTFYAYKFTMFSLKQTFFFLIFTIFHLEELIITN